MSWTDERVELLKKLWMEGLSASQIAGELGDGVTRNAVIGKVHRLKLSGRARPVSSAPRARPVPRPPIRRIGTSSSALSAAANIMKRRIVSAPMIGATALKVNYELETELEAAPQPVELFVPEHQRVSLLGLTEQTCKWPIGDPLTKDFYFCGQHAEGERPYCEFHSRRAYHVADRKKR